MENVNLKQEGNNANTLLSAVVVHPHPIVEMQIKNFKKDEVEIDKHIGSFSGTINEMIFVFSIVDIIQISPRSEFEIKIDPKLLERSRQHLKFR